jgi:PKHD-type hydroxylase
MSTHKPLWYLKELPEDFCDLAIKDFSIIQPADARMGQFAETENHQQRNTTVRFVDNGHWLPYIMHGIAREANQVCGWGYDITSFENLQFAEYGIDQHYDWHIDFFPLSEKELDRKVSVVCLMSDPAEFEGGDFEVRLYGTYKVPLKKGSVVAFPSILEHRVTPVTSGVRYSSTIWMNGPKFK